MTQGFLSLLGTEKKGAIISLSSGHVTTNLPGGNSGYGVSKLAAAYLQSYVAVEYPNVAAVSMAPGMVASDMTKDNFRRFALDTPELSGGVAVWLATDAATFLSGKYIDVNWSVDELLERKEEISANRLLAPTITGRFGKDQFA